MCVSIKNGYTMESELINKELVPPFSICNGLFAVDSGFPVPFITLAIFFFFKQFYLYWKTFSDLGLFSLLHQFTSVFCLNI